MKRFKNILCVLNPEEASTLALERAITLAENNQASLAVVSIAPHVAAGISMPDGGPISAELQTATVNSYKQKLETFVEPYRQRIKMETSVLVGTPFLEIIRDVLRNGRDMVIKAPEKLGWLDRLFGSDDMHLLRKCPCPVWLIKPQAPKAFRRILAAVDVDDIYPPHVEVVEHVADLPGFMQACCELVAPDGVMAIATINRTWLSWLFAIVGAEYILRWLPKGTHQWRRFPKPEELEQLLANHDMNVIARTGVRVNPLTRGFHLTSLMAVNYMLMASH